MIYYSNCFTAYYYPWSLDSISILHSQCTFSTPWGAFWTGATSGVHTCHIKRQITFASYQVPIYLYTWVECSNVLLKEKKCRALTGIEPPTLWSRVKGSIQYTAAPPHINDIILFFFRCFIWWNQHFWIANYRKSAGSLFFFFGGGGPSI